MNPNPQTTTQIRAEKADAKRMDRIAPRLEAKQGGTWSRPQVLKAALDALESKLSSELKAV